jgi:hypothetical protein
VLGNDTDEQNDLLSATRVDPPQNGSVTFNSDGSFSYLPDPNFSGVDSFSYKVSDGRLDSNTATVRITVNSVNDLPSISGATVSRQQGAAGSASTIATVSDVEDPVGSLTVSVDYSPTGITVTGITNTNGAIAATVTAACNAAVGANAVGMRVTDSGGAIATANLIVNITASTPPPLTLKAPLAPFPNNHKYTTVTINQMVQSATDSCDGNLINSVVIERVTSDEADNAQGDSDGDTTNDILIGANCRSVQLRAERNSNRNGRVYVVTLRVTDSSGNTVRAEYKVSVPLSQNGNPAIQDSPVYIVNSSCP